MKTAPTTMITIIKTGWQQHRNALSQLRETVFIGEQKISAADEWDDKDESAAHYLVFSENQPIACARLLINNATGKIGRVCVLPAFRRQHIATQLLQFIIDDAKNSQLATLALDAQVNVTSLYSALGFQAIGETFMDAGILHQGMTLKI
jgi:predicted GNAT family N-acyltransferase